MLLLFLPFFRIFGVEAAFSFSALVYPVPNFPELSEANLDRIFTELTFYLDQVLTVVVLREVSELLYEQRD